MSSVSSVVGLLVSLPPVRHRDEPGVLLVQAPSGLQPHEGGHLGTEEIGVIGHSPAAPVTVRNSRRFMVCRLSSRCRKSQGVSLQAGADRVADRLKATLLPSAESLARSHGFRAGMPHPAIQAKCSESEVSVATVPPPRQQGTSLTRRMRLSPGRRIDAGRTPVVECGRW